jgi:hypothetical protein
MLKTFYVKNYKSWKEGAFIDMKAESINEHLSNVIYYRNHKEKILKNCVIYGANASGKSNIIDAITYMYLKVFEVKNHETLSGTFSPSPQIENIFNRNLFEYKGPLCKTYANKVGSSVFEITFIKNDNEFCYGFEVRQENIIDEWFEINNKVIFSRKKKIVDKIKAYKPIIDIVPNTRLFLSYIIHFAQIKKDSDMFYLVQFFSNIIVIKDLEKMNFLLLNEILANMYLNNKKTLIKMNNVFKLIDFGIERMEFDPQTKRIYFIHKSSKETFNVYLNDESLGTKKVLYILLFLFDRLEHGGIIIADEFTASIHPLLLKLILDMISDEEINLGNCQTLFSTHDIFFMRKEQFRRDEINFIYKSKIGISQITRLYDFKDRDMKRVRNDATYWKNYLKGMYDAIPDINYDLLVKDNKVSYGKISKS